jgi:hypothetical protein
VAHLLLADGNQRRKQIDNAFEIACAAPWPRPFVVQRVKAVAILSVENNQILLASTKFCIRNPVLGLFGFGGENQTSHPRCFQQAVSQFLAAATALSGAGRARDKRSLYQVANAQMIAIGKRQYRVIEDGVVTW